MGESKRVKKKKNRKKGDSLGKIGWDGKDLNILRGNRKMRKWENTCGLKRMKEKTSIKEV
jgi:hypothetical protein